jgi:hypothetical protein
MADHTRTGRWEPYVARPARTASVTPQASERRGRWQPYRSDERSRGQTSPAQLRVAQSAEVRVAGGRGRWEPYRP